MKKHILQKPQTKGEKSSEPYPVNENEHPAPDATLEKMKAFLTLLIKEIDKDQPSINTSPSKETK
jgi:hypothetical protein